MAQLWYLLHYNQPENPESVVFCDSEEISFLSRYTLSQLSSRPSHFDCPHAHISKKGNLCCELLSGSFCPTYKAMRSENPPVEPIPSQFTNSKTKNPNSS